MSVCSPFPLQSIIFDDGSYTVDQKDKNSIYYSIITFFVLTTVVSTVLTAAFLILSILLWRSLKNNRFFWFLIQVFISTFIHSASNLVIYVPANLGLLSRNHFVSEIFNITTYVIDFFHYSVVFSIFVIAINRGMILFEFGREAFERHFMFIWLGFIWTLSAGAELVFMSTNCRYEYDIELGKFQMKCENVYGTLVVRTDTPTWVRLIDSIIHIGLPTFIFCTYLAIIIKILYRRNLTLKGTEKSTLKLAMLTFVLFQIPSLIFLGSRFTKMSRSAGFLVRPLVNALEMFAGIVLLLYFSFTSLEIRKIMSVRVYIIDSDHGANAPPENRMQDLALEN